MSMSNDLLFKGKKKSITCQAFTLVYDKSYYFNYDT